MSDTQITIKSYGWAELAEMYNPGISLSAASKILRKWVNVNLELKAALHKASWRKRAKRLTPLQVEILFSYLGYP